MRLAFALAAVLLAPGIASARTIPPFPDPAPPTGSKWDGLNLLLTRDRLREIEDALRRGDPLATQAYGDAIAAADAALTRSPNPIHGVLRVPSFYSSQRATQQRISAQIRGDGRTALALAWGYALTGRQAYADRAKAFIFAWVASLTRPVDGAGAGGFDAIEDWIIGQTGGDTALVAHYSLPLFIDAYDILNGFGQVSPAEKSAFRRWLAPFVRYRLTEDRFPNNHLSWHALFLAEAAHVTEDQNLFDAAIAYHRDGMAHQAIAADGALWRELARGDKAATYTLMALEAMTRLAVISDNHGVHGLSSMVGGARRTDSKDDLELKWVTRLKHSGVASAGGSLRSAVDALRDFVNDPRAWNRWSNVIRSGNVTGPADPSDWGWLFELAARLWNDPSYLALAKKAPYGIAPERAYTLAHATLLFRDFR